MIPQYISAREGTTTLTEFQPEFGKLVMSVERKMLVRIRSQILRTFSLIMVTFSFVINTTGSMRSEIVNLKTQISSLADALSIGGKNTRIGVVEFKDATYSQPSQVIFPFTEQDDFADRQAATIAAIDGLTYSVGYGYGGYGGYYTGESENYYSSSEILPPQPTQPNGFSVGGGGDSAETPFDGLRVALDGSMGEWRAVAGTRQIVLITDAPVKDAALISQVNALAQNIGATIGSSFSLALAGGSIDTFNLSVSGGLSGAGRDSEGAVDPNLPDDPIVLDPIDPDPTTVAVQIFVVYTGSTGDDTSALSEIASANGGTFQTAPIDNELIKKLMEIISSTSVINGTPDADRLVGTDGNDAIYGPAGNDQIYGGAGNDIFAYNSPTEGIDKINDFVVGEDRFSSSLRPRLRSLLENI
jgi:Ca2+-binding RTX toxin-like protein